MKCAIATSLLVITAALFYPSCARAGTVAVRFAEGVAHGFPVLRSVDGQEMAGGEFTQISRDDVVDVQRGASFPETLEASIDSGMLGTLMKNLAPSEDPIVQLLVFTPQPRVIKVQIAVAGEDTLMLGRRPVPVIRYLIKPQLGLFASLLVVDLDPIQCWVIGGEAPAFVKFQGPLYFMGPVWRIELN